MDSALYQKKVTDQARSVFDDIFVSVPQSFSRLKKLNVLVIGAGRFPSFFAAGE